MLLWLWIKRTLRIEPYVLRSSASATVTLALTDTLVNTVTGQADVLANMTVIDTVISAMSGSAVSVATLNGSVHVYE